MKREPGWIFLYGTLLPGLARGHSARIIQRLGPAVEASLRGRMFAVSTPIGSYPAFCSGGTGLVLGAVCRLPMRGRARMLAEFDAYEGEDYRRATVRAQCAGGRSLQAWAYVHFGALPPRHRPVAHGDFARFLAEGGHAAYAA